jgi:ADP-ribose pyrophosphatase
MKSRWSTTPGRRPDLTEKTLSSQVVFAGRALKMRVDTVLTADGRRSTREIVERSDCVAVIAIDNKGNVLLERQFRQAIDKELLEIPAGGIDAGEKPEAAVVREMREETGFRPQKVIKLIGFFSSPGYTTEYLHLYLATDLIPDPLSAEDSAGIEVMWVTPAQISEMISSGKIQDAKSIAGLLFYVEYLKKKEI